MKEPCYAKKPSLQCKQGFFGDKSPFSSPQNARIPAFTAMRNSWKGTSRCQIILLHILYLPIFQEVGRPARQHQADKYKKEHHKLPSCCRAGRPTSCLSNLLLLAKVCFYINLIALIPNIGTTAAIRFSDLTKRQQFKTIVNILLL